MEYRNKQLNFRVTQAEYQTIKRRMELVGVTYPSAFLRKMAIDGYLIKLDLSDLKEIARLTRINSNNLNQYAKQANENGSIYFADIKELQDGQEEIIELLRKMLKRLSNLK